MTGVRWDVREIMSQHNAYVDILVRVSFLHSRHLFVFVFVCVCVCAGPGVVLVLVLVLLLLLWSCLCYVYTRGFTRACVHARALKRVYTHGNTDKCT